MLWETDLRVFLLPKYTMSGPVAVFSTCRFDPGPMVDFHSTLLTGMGTWVYAMEGHGTRRSRHCRFVSLRKLDFVVSVDGCREHRPKMSFSRRSVGVTGKGQCQMPKRS